MKVSEPPLRENDPTRLAVQLIVDGYVSVPGVFVGDELEAVRDGFERRAAELGKRWLDWADIETDPALLAAVCPPRLVAVVDAFMAHFGEETVFANCSGARDVFDPAKPVPEFEPGDLRQGPVGWHDDVVGMKDPNAAFLPTAVASLIYLDDTFAHSGAYCSAVGSHHLGYAGPDGRPVRPPGKLAINACELRPVPVRAGGAVLHRAYHVHGVVPVGQRRRSFLQGFCARSVYDLQQGHSLISDATMALLPADRHKYLCAYASA